MCKKAWIYSRIAGEPDKHLTMQTERLRQYATDNGLEIIGISEERFSGRIMDRPGLTEVEQAAQQGRMDILLVQSLSRIARARDVNAWINGIVDCGVEVRAIKEGLTFNQQHRPFDGTVLYCRVATEPQEGATTIERNGQVGGHKA